MTFKITGIGAYLPEHIVTNSELAETIGSSEEWIFLRTGISQRHVASKSEYSSHLGFKAALNAIKDSGIDKSEIDLVVVASTTADNSFPSTATKIQSLLGLGCTPSFDIQAVCAGFIYGLDICGSMISSEKYNNILFICTEKMSSLLDQSDRSTSVLFGDGAAALVLSKSTDVSTLIDSAIYSDGSYHDLLYTDGGISMNGEVGKIRMKGQEVFRLAISNMVNSTRRIVEANNLTIDDIDHFVPHQANVRIIDAVAEQLTIPHSKIVKTINKHANCSAASIPLALSELKSSGKLKTGDIIACTAVGAGLTWGSALIRY